MVQWQQVLVYQYLSLLTMTTFCLIEYYLCFLRLEVAQALFGALLVIEGVCDGVHTRKRLGSFFIHVLFTWCFPHAFLVQILVFTDVPQGVSLRRAPLHGPCTSGCMVLSPLH